MSTPDSEPTKEAGFFTAIRSWNITRGDERVFGGVLSGVGARIGMAPVPTRIIFALLALFIGGPLIVLYAAAWALLPDSEGRIIIQDFGRGTPNVGALVAIGIMTLVGIGVFGNPGWNRWWNLGVWDLQFGDSPGPGWVLGMVLFLIPAALIAGVVWLIVWSVRYGRNEDREEARAAQGFARMPDGTVPTGAPVAEATVTNEKTTEAAIAAELATEPTASPAFAQPPAPPVYQAPKHHHVPKPRVPGPGKFGYLAALAMIPISAATTLYLHTTDQLAVFPLVAGGVIWVAGLGLILIINALRGRKAGFLGFVSVVALIPIGITIAAADDIRDRYENSSGWFAWSDGYYEEWRPMPEPEYTPPPALDASVSFADYETIAINGACYGDTNEFTPDITGTVRLASVDADQTIAITSSTTLLSIPKGTNLTIVNDGGIDGSAWSTVVWTDRDVICDLETVGAPAAQLANADAPTLTVHLDDTMTDGSQSLFIEEN